MQKTQRIGAYAVAFSGESLLLTRISPLGFPVGWWGLPGGGIEQGESPRTAMEREVGEETGLPVRSARLVDVHDVHTVEPGRADQYEDYHGIHLLYVVDVPLDEEPRVVETEGTTDAVRWVPLADLRAGALGPLLPSVEYVLERLDQFVAAGTGVPSGAGGGDQNSTA